MRDSPSPCNRVKVPLMRCFIFSTVSHEYVAFTWLNHAVAISGVMSLTVSHRLRCLRASACTNAVKSSNHPFTIAHQAGVGAFPRDTFCQFANSFASGRPPKSSPVRALCALRWSSAGSFCDSLRHASNAFFAALRERSNAASPLAVSLTFPALSTGILPSTDTFRLGEGEGA